MNIKSFFKKSWDEGTQIGKLNCLTTVILGTSAHFCFPFIFKYVFGIYENFFLRMVASLLCTSLLFIYNRKITTAVSIYWHFVFIFVLPFIFTVNLLKSNFNELWLYWEIFMIFVLITYIPNWLIFLIDLLIGVGMAIFYYLLTPSLVPLTLNFNVILYSIVVVFSALVGVVFAYNNRATSLNKLKEQYLQLTSMAGSIVHEIRNPLNAINLSVFASTEVLKSNQENKISEALKYNGDISSSINKANEIINIVLSDLKDKPIEASDFSYLDASKILPEIVKKYGYSSEIEKQKVKLDVTLENNFIFKAVEDRFTFIIYNLLKNALYYLKEYPTSIVTVGAEKRIIKDREYNVVYIHDTGPGISSDIFSRLFDDFFTSGKKEGTGLGLAFCKKNMRIFDGDIIVESQAGENNQNEKKNGWTKFSLLFPKLSEEEIKEASIKARMRKILIVDDQQVNLLTAKSRIEQNLPNIICDMANSGFQAINLAKNNKYSLILMDIQMPEIDGIAATKEIRRFNQDIPIIAFTSLDLGSFSKQVNCSVLESDFSDCLNKNAPRNILYRSITKWITDIKDDFPYLGSKEEYSRLHGKNILLADDQEMNLMMVKINLEKNGLVVTEVSDGKELLEIYKKSLDANGKSSFDMIITDINMPPYNGDVAAKEIRSIELNNHLQYKNIIPIIAVSGDGQKEDIRHFFASGITDYFIKGTDPELLIKIVANYLVWKNRKMAENQKKIQEQKIELKDDLVSNLNLKIV